MSSWSRINVTNFASFSAVSLVASASIAIGIALILKNHKQHTVRGVVGSSLKNPHRPGYDLVVDFRTLEGNLSSATVQTLSEADYRIGEPVNVRYQEQDSSFIQVEGYDGKIIGKWMIMIGLVVLLVHAIKMLKS